jgi:hypothetical protein
MESSRITGLDELEAHLDELLKDATVPLNARLFDHVELQLTRKMAEQNRSLPLTIY